MPTTTRVINVQYAVRVDLTVETDDEGNTTKILSASTPYIGDNQCGGDAYDRYENTGHWRDTTEQEWYAGEAILNGVGVRSDY
jgi:hypothetical protein